MKSILFLAISQLMVVGACSNRRDINCDCENLIELPIPSKIIRKSEGFDPVSKSITLDFSSNLAEHSKTNSIDSLDSCRGNIDFSLNAEQWKASTKLMVCTNVNDTPLSDGNIESLVFYFSDSEKIPATLTSTQDGEWTTLQVLESFSASIEGNQQYDCSGSFAIDTLITEAVPCLEFR